MKTYLKVMMSHRIYGRVQTVTTIILTLEMFAAIAKEISIAIKRRRQKRKKIRKYFAGDVISATLQIISMKSINVVGVKNSHNQRQIFSQLKLKIYQRSNWNHQSRLKFQNQFQNYKSILNQLKLLSQSNNQKVYNGNAPVAKQIQLIKVQVFV